MLKRHVGFQTSTRRSIPIVVRRCSFCRTATSINCRLLPDPNLPVQAPCKRSLSLLDLASCNNRVQLHFYDPQGQCIRPKLSKPLPWIPPNPSCCQNRVDWKEKSFWHSRPCCLYMKRTSSFEIAIAYCLFLLLTFRAVRLLLSLVFFLSGIVEAGP